MDHAARFPNLGRESFRRAQIPSTESSRVRPTNSGIAVRVASPADVQMSEVIKDFAAPLLKRATEAETIRKAIKFAILVWNTALDWEEQEEEEMPESLVHLLADPHVRDDFQMLLNRKEALFRGNKRIIIDYVLRERETGIALDVVSTF